MIAALLLRYGIPTWVAKIAAYALLVTIVVTSAFAYRTHVFNSGVAEERGRRDAIEIANSVKAEKELAVLNGKMLAAQSALDQAIADLNEKKVELQNEQNESLDYQRRLAAGTERMSALVRERRIAQAGSAPSSTIGGVDSDSYVIQDLSEQSAIAIERVRANENAAIDRLNACIKAYDAVEAASKK